MTTDQPTPPHVFAEHRRDWRQNRYVYPVISRRSRGLSIGVNLNPDKVCNFNCIYCQVDRTVEPWVRSVDPVVLEDELDRMVAAAADESLFAEQSFAATPPELRRFNDIAFSGDGEPTTCPLFAECVRIAAAVKGNYGLDEVKIVLITNACHLTKPAVVAGLDVLAANNGEIWAKLDAGTEERYRMINRSRFPLQHIVDGITAAARDYSVCIQSLWMRIDGQGPPAEEVDAFAARLNEIAAAGGSLKEVQVYTVARRPLEESVAALTVGELRELADTVAARTGLRVNVFPAAG